MLIDGAKINIPFEKDIVIPRPDKDIVLHVAAVPFEDEFKMAYPQPQPPVLKDITGAIIKRDFDDKNYRKKIEEWTIARLDFLVIKSVKNVEWETVILEDKETWSNWKKECLSSGMTDPEVLRIVNETFEIHNPTQDMVEKMRADFLASAHLNEE